MTNAPTLLGLHLDLPSTGRAARAVLGRMKPRRPRPRTRTARGLKYMHAMRVLRPHVARQLDAEQDVQIDGLDQRTLWAAAQGVVRDGDDTMPGAG